MVELHSEGVDCWVAATGGVVGIESPAMLIIVEDAAIVSHPCVSAVGRVDVEEVVFLHLATGERGCDKATAYGEGQEGEFQIFGNHNCQLLIINC